MWETKDWFVSPWNYSDEVTEGFEYPEKIKIHDVTLRDGEQQAGLIFNFDQKLRIAERLAEMGVHRIEAGMPAVSKTDEKAIKEIVKRNLGPEIFAFGRCMVDDVKRAVDCGVTGIVIEIPSSEHIIKNAYGWSLEKAINLSIEATQYAKENNLYTVFFPIDASRANIDWVINLLERVATEGHMDALALVDTFGGLSPHAIPYLVKKIRERIKKPLEAHFHNDFGLGTANTLLALASGVEVAHTTISGIGAAESNVDLFKLRTAKRGRAWSKKGLEAVLRTLGLLYEGLLHNSIRQLDLSLGEADTEKLISMSASDVAKTVGRKALGIRQAGFPAIKRGTEGYAMLFRSILNLDPVG